MDFKNEALEKVTPFNHGNVFNIHVRFQGCIPAIVSEKILIIQVDDK